MDLTSYRRFQVTLFVPEPVASDLDVLRQRWDPVMAMRIRPHITVLRRVDNARVALAALHGSERWTACRLALGSVRQAEPAHGSGVFVEVVDPYSDLSRLRAALAEAVAADDDAVQTHPHVTLAHPRTVPPDRIADAWRSLHDARLDHEFVIDRITLIGESDVGWSSVDSATLADAS